MDYSLESYYYLLYPRLRPQDTCCSMWTLCLHHHITVDRGKHRRGSLLRHVEIIFFFNVEGKCTGTETVADESSLLLGGLISEEQEARRCAISINSA